jgi:hypothetical protein
MTGASTLRATAQGVRQPAGATFEYILHKIGPVKNHTKKSKLSRLSYSRSADRILVRKI